MKFVSKKFRVFYIFKVRYFMPIKAKYVSLSSKINKNG